MDSNNKLARFNAPNSNVSQNFQDDDLWGYIANNQEINFGLNTRIQNHIDWISTQPDYLASISKRAEPFLYLVVSETERQGVPIEIALLPIVESDYYPFSYSHGTATGLWQFIPSTGKMYGLDDDWWHEDRRDVLASTEAAIRYLKDLNKMFDGDWLVSIAAYNAGPGRVQRAIDKNLKEGKKIDYWSLDLPKETERYVPKLLAIGSVLKNPALHNQTLTKIKNKPFLEAIQLDSQFDLALIAQWTGLSIKEIYSYNPGLKRWATPEDLPYTILLPQEVINQFSDNLAKQGNRTKISWTRYQVKKGDSLSLIAEIYKTTVDQIKSANELNNDLIKLNSCLLYTSPSPRDVEESRMPSSA